MKIIISASLLLTTLLFLTACQKNSNSQDAVDSPQAEVVDMHNAQNSLDWEGSYFGTLPCASCPGINTFITLSKYGHFDKTEEYIGSDQEPKTISGTIQWYNNGSILKLGEQSYLVAEDRLVMLDAEQQPIEGSLSDAYMLKKTELQPEPDYDDGIELKVFIGNNNVRYYIVFNSVANPETVIIQYDDKKIELSLDGDGVYSNASNTTKLTLLNSNAQLSLNDTVILLSPW